MRQRLVEATHWQGTVHSAGIGALVDHAADESTQALMQAQGINLETHRARQLTVEILRDADLVLVMERHHRQAVLDMYPAARGKTYLLGHWRNSEIADPYRRGREAHAESLRLIELAVESWLEKLGSSR